MTEQRMVPVELLEGLLEFLLCHSNRWDGHTKHPQLIVEQARAIIDGPEVEPVAEVVIPNDTELPWCFGRNTKATITPGFHKLYLAAQSAPAQAVPDDWQLVLKGITNEQKTAMAQDLSTCPQCGGEADNGHDRCIPPSAYMCRKCCMQEDAERAALANIKEAS